MKCKLKIGTKVRIAKVVQKQKGWTNVWVPSMTRRVNDGRVYLVSAVNKQGVRLLNDTDYMGWPSKALRTYSRGKPLNGE
jgi:hypothetical protein